jgi:hypothetical protein
MGDMMVMMTEGICTQTNTSLKKQQKRGSVDKQFITLRMINDNN